jgi:hypothetical protein
MGENPIVQVINDETGYLAVPGNSLGLGASFILEEIKINLSGDVTLVHGTAGPFPGRVIIA